MGIKIYGYFVKDINFGSIYGNLLKKWSKKFFHLAPLSYPHMNFQDLLFPNCPLLLFSIWIGSQVGEPENKKDICLDWFSQ